MIPLFRYPMCESFCRIVTECRGFGQLDVESNYYKYLLVNEILGSAQSLGVSKEVECQKV